MQSTSLYEIIDSVRDQFAVTRERLFKYLEYELDIGVTTITRLVEFESVRVQFLANSTSHDELPCRLFLPKEHQRHAPCVQIGGSPYRPNDLPWPKWSPGGESPTPMQFLGQFRFDHSIPLPASLPGDFLLIFVGDLYWLTSDYPEDLFHYEWYQLPFTAARHAWPITWVGHECMPYDTFDVISASLIEEIEKRLTAAGWRQLESYYARHILCWPGIKTGGASVFGTMPHFPNLLCSVCSDGAPMGIIYPYVDKPQPVEEYNWSPEFTAGDGVQIEFFWDDDAQRVIAEPHYY